MPTKSQVNLRSTRPPTPHLHVNSGSIKRHTAIRERKAINHLQIRQRHAKSTATTVIRAIREKRIFKAIRKTRRMPLKIIIFTFLIALENGFFTLAIFQQVDNHYCRRLVENKLLWRGKKGKSYKSVSQLPVE